MICVTFYKLVQTYRLQLSLCEQRSGRFCPQRQLTIAGFTFACLCTAAHALYNAFLPTVGMRALNVMPWGARNPNRLQVRKSGSAC
jgi:hypothetical protein